MRYLNRAEMSKGLRPILGLRPLKRVSVSFLLVPLHPDDDGRKKEEKIRKLAKTSSSTAALLFTGDTFSLTFFLVVVAVVPLVHSSSIAFPDIFTQMLLSFFLSSRGQSVSNGLQFLQKCCIIIANVSFEAVNRQL